MHLIIFLTVRSASASVLCFAVVTLALTPDSKEDLVFI